MKLRKVIWHDCVLATGLLCLGLGVLGAFGLYAFLIMVGLAALFHAGAMR